MKSSDRRAEQERAEATLATIDAALEAGQAGDHDERARELGELALTLRAGVPEPSASFAADLEERVWAGFEEEEQTTRTRARRLRSMRRPGTGAPRRRLTRDASAALATVLVGLVAVGALLADGGAAVDGIDGGAAG